MRNPAIAVLWEAWRLSRNRQLIVMLITIVVGAAFLVGLEGDAFTATHVMLFAAVLTFVGYGWVREDRGNRFALSTGFTRPIPTWILVTVPMAYIFVSTAATYLIPMFVLSAVFGMAFPLLPLAAALSTISLISTAAAWCTGSGRFRLGLGILVSLTYLPWYFTTGNSLSPDRWSEVFSFSGAHYVVMGLIAGASVVLTIVGVSLRRRGDDLADYFRRPVSGAAPGRTTASSRLSTALRVRCPVSSPTAAQIWFEARTSGLRILSYGMRTAVVLAAVGWLIPEYLFEAVQFWAFLLPPIVGIRRILGVRRKDGVSYLSSFDTTRPIGTGRLIGLKIGIAVLAIMLSFLAIGVAIWISISGRPTAQAIIADYFGTPTIFKFAIASFAVTAIMAYAASVHAFLLLNARRFLTIFLGAGLYLVGLIYMVATGRWGNTVIEVHIVIVSLLLFGAVLYCFREALARRVVSPLYIPFAILTVLIFYVSMLGWLNPGASIGDPTEMLILSIPGLLATVLPPWSFSRIRHR